MAIFERQTINKVSIDDTEAIKCTIENWLIVDGHTEFVIKIYRGPLSNETWKINKRYNDFYKLHNLLQISGISLELPSKKLIGNMDPYFINERQRGLQKYLERIFMNPILASSLPARSFVDPANYCQPFAELALQHVSLALRGESGWEVVGPISNMGWRLRKHYYQLKCKTLPKEELLGAWTDYGPDKYLESRDMHTICKSLRQLQHPYLHSIELCLCTETGALVARISHKEGTLRDLLCGSKPRQSFLKKYGNPKGHKPLAVGEISLYGRQILEALKFLHDKGFPYGHLHSGNVIIDYDRVKLLEIENGILGVPSYYRPYFTQHKKINNMAAIDVYCFGHVLYEMMFGAPLRESVIENIQDCVIKNILDRILTPQSCRSGLPTVIDLLSEPFFSVVELQFWPTDKVHLKIPSSVKERIKVAVAKMEDRLKEEQKMVRSQKRLARMQEMMSSKDENEKRKYKQKVNQCKENPSNNNRDTDNSTPTSTGSNIPSSSPPPPPPPPPPLIPPLQSVTPSPPMMNGNIRIVEGSKDQSALLSAIHSFDKNALRKTKIT